MNKLFTKIATAFVGIAMAIGAGVAIGSHSDVRRANAADLEATSSVNSASGTSSWTLLNGSDSIVDVVASAVTTYASQLRMAANSTLTFTPHSGQSITMKSIRFKTNSTTSYMPGSGSTYTVDGGSATSFTANGSTNASLTLGTTASSSVVIKFGNAIRLTELGVTYTVGGGGGGGGAVITDYSQITAGSYNIVYRLNNSSTDYYMTTTLDGSSRFTSSTTEADAGVFTFESTGTANEWYVSCDLSGTKTYFKPHASSNGVSVRSTSNSGMGMTAAAGVNGNIRLGVGSRYMQRNGTAGTNIIGSYNGGQRDIFKLIAVSQNYTVTFEMQGHGSAVSSQSIASGGKVTQPTAPTATGWSFGGWYKEAGCTNAWNFTTDIVSADTIIYAKWTATTYSISYTLNGGTHGSTHPTSGTYDTIFSVSAPTKTGFTFTGWTVTSGLNSSTAKWGTTSSPATAISSSSTLCVNGTSDVYFKNISANSTAVTLTANWSINTYTVSGSITHGSLYNTDSVEYEGDLINQIIPSDGYTYPDIEDVTIMMGSTDITASAYDSSDGSILYEGVIANVTITATCKAVGTSYTVTYNANSGTVSPTSEEVVKNGNPSFPTPTRSGYNFKGWQVNGSGTAYFDPEDYTVTGDVTFVASWVAVYTVTFNSNGGSVSPESQSVESGSTFTFPSAGSKSHYSFDGWTSTGSTPYYAAGATSPVVSGNITYTAHWTEDVKYTVTYEAGTHGTGSYTYETSYYNGESHTLLAFANLIGITIDDSTTYRFKDFTVDGNTKAPGEAITIGSSNVIVTVNFEEIPPEYDVTYDFSQIDFTDWTNSYSGQHHTINYDQGDVYFDETAKPASGQTIDDIPVTKGGYATFVAGEGIEITEATFVLRQWGSKTKTVELWYSTDGGSNYTTTSITSSNFTISSNNLPSGTNAIKITFSDSSNQVGFESLTISYLGGEAPVLTYTVTYNGNGSDGGTTPVDENSPYNASATVTTLENTFTRTGYTFSSWNTAPDGSGNSYDEGAQFTISANTILYAIWEQGGGGGSATAARCYHLVESTDDLVAGAKYIIASTSTIASHAMSTTQNSNNRGEETVTISNSTAAISSDGVQVVTLGGSTGAWTFAVSGGYLYAASSSANHLKTESEVDANGTWAISFSDGIASIVAQGSNSRNVMQYNSGSGLFACYASASQTGVSLYRLDFGETLLHNITCSGSGSYTIAEGYAWSDLKSVYQDLPSAEQTSLKTASNAGLVRYDYLVGKYGTSTFENFIGRTVTPIGHSSAILLTALGNKSTNTSIIVIVTVGIAAIAIGGYFLLRKKKED